MPNRHLSRMLAMQCLYEWDFQKNKDINEIVTRNEKAFLGEDLDKKYIKKIVSGVIKNLTELDKGIQDAASQWPLEQIPILDKTLLRLSVYELIYMDDIPPKVAINEAVELGKTFGSENTSKFVNGVLGTLYKVRHVDIEDKDMKSRWQEIQGKIKKSQKNEEKS